MTGMRIVYTGWQLVQGTGASKPFPTSSVLVFDLLKHQDRGGEGGGALRKQRSLRSRRQVLRVALACSPMPRIWLWLASQARIRSGRSRP